MVSSCSGVVTQGRWSLPISTWARKISGGVAKADVQRPAGPFAMRPWPMRRPSCQRECHDRTRHHAGTGRRARAEARRIRAAAGHHRAACRRFTELGIFSAMWNEHCSYKSSKKWLRTLPTTGPQVICGPGENAGVVDIGDGQAVIFKMESHNHPSYIEPHQGAATGVGGILRDVFTMGARPIAAMNALSLRRAVASQDRASGQGRGRGRRRLWQCLWRADRGRRGAVSSQPITATVW